MGSAYAICHAWVNRRKAPLQFMSPNPPPEVIQKPQQLQILEHFHDPLTTQKKHLKARKESGSPQEVVAVNCNFSNAYVRILYVEEATFHQFFHVIR